MLSSARVLTNLAKGRTIPVTEMKSSDEPPDPRHEPPIDPRHPPDPCDEATGRRGEPTVDATPPPEREDVPVDDDRPDVLLTGLLFYDLVLTGLGGPPAAA